MRPTQQHPPVAVRGFTLIEVLVALTVSVLLAGLALPSFSDHWRAARRSDAVAALTRVQLAQEQYRAHHGLYAADLSMLAVAARSDQGWYDLHLVREQPQAFTATALARVDGSQSGDSACTSITLAVSDGLAEHGPEPRCWQR